MEKFLDDSTITLIDAKTQLQEYSLKKYKELPKYTFYKKTGPQHRPTFKTDVQIPDSKKIVGMGTSKKTLSKMQQLSCWIFLKLYELGR